MTGHGVNKGMSMGPKKRRVWAAGGTAIIAAGGIAVLGAPASGQFVPTDPLPGATPPAGQLPGGPPPSTQPPSVGTPAPGPPADTGKGSFSAPIVEPTIKGKRTDEKCQPKQDPKFDRDFDCKPTAGSINTLPNGNIVYWDALEGTENINNSIVAEYGRVSENDTSRLLRFVNGLPTWDIPETPDGGANPTANDPNTTPSTPIDTGSKELGNNGALFCADLNFLADGRIIAVGGTDYLSEPGVETPDGLDAPAGVVELAGVSASRIYDPATNSWSQTGRMSQGRWYPTLVTKGDGNIFVASGLEKLIKPVNNSGSSGGNVRETETFDAKAGKWTQNPASSNRSLPLFPRLHLLPNGHVLYNGGGQAFNPFGQDYAEAQWNIAASFDPKTNMWKELGVPGATTGVTTLPGFRGSASSTMLPLKPNADGSYTKAEFLSAGGVPNPPSPGGYIAVPQSQIATVDTTKGNEMTTAETGPLATGRWYGTQTLLPTGEILMTGGSDRDEVVAPGVEIPTRTAELYDPKTKTWRTLATSPRARTYHNSASLLPDGRVAVAGHAPISTLYGKNITVAEGVTGPNDGRDPTFEFFSPPYFERGPRPEIASVAVDGAAPVGGAEPIAAAYGKSAQLTLTEDVADIENVVLMRHTSTTHIVDGDQRSVELKILKREGKSLTVAMPSDPNVLPPGSYMLYANRSTSKGLVPSVARTVFAGAPVPASQTKSGGGTATACASKVGFTAAAAKRSGRGLAISFASRQGNPADVDIFQHSQGRKILKERLIARFRGKKAAFRWNGKALRGKKVRDGLYSVRYKTRTASGGSEFRRVVLERKNGRFTTRPDHYRRTTCDVLSSFKLERPAFGGPSNRKLGIAFRLASGANVTVSVTKGKRTVKRFKAVTVGGGRTVRLSMSARGMRRGDYKVRAVVTRSGGEKVSSTLTSKRL